MLKWGVMTRFRDYVGELDDGLESWKFGTDGERRGLFPLHAGAGGMGPRRWEFSGFVKFAGHGGFLNVSISSPRITTDSGQVAVSVDTAPPGVRERRIDFAYSTLPPVEQDAGGTVVFRGLALTDSGAHLLGSVYEPGTGVDDAVVSFSESGVSNVNPGVAAKRF